tara:strand:+ start:667 stop:1320 length:654 start_codon:yes stop_codon:yes gene_type:complete
MAKTRYTHTSNGARHLPPPWLIFVLVVLFFTCPYSLSTPLYAQETADTSLNRGSFSLVDHSGRAVTQQNFRGSYLLIFFGYSHCPDICPTALTLIATVMDSLGENSKSVQPIFITLDPERDTPEVLQKFVSYFHPKLIGLTGTPDQVATVAKEYFVRYQRVTQRPSDSTLNNKEGLEYFLDHTAASYLLGPNAEGIALFRHGTSAAEIAEKIRNVMK